VSLEPRHIARCIIHTVRDADRGEASLADIARGLSLWGIVDTDPLPVIREMVDEGLLRAATSAVDLAPRWSIPPAVIERACVVGLGSFIDDAITGEV
jgi:hypothetical protein